MSEVILWACSICAGAAVCLVCEMLLPSGKISKVVKFAVGVFMVGVIILPLGNMIDAVASELDNIEVEDYSAQLESTSEQDAAKLAKENVRELVEEQLGEIGVSAQKIEIVTDSDKLSDITGIESVIYINNKDRGQGLKIKNRIKDKLGLDCRIAVIGENEDE